MTAGRLFALLMAALCYATAFGIGSGAQAFGVVLFSCLGGVALSVALMGIKP